MDLEDTVDSLVEFGFTRLEAEVYITLLKQSPITAYGIAQALGKPVANTYKAIESLQRKGAAIVDEAETRMCRAVPPDELLGQIERRLSESRNRARQGLSKVQSASADDRVYQLRSREQVMGRCKNMLNDCRQIALLDVFPSPLEELRADIEAAARRGLAVALKVYQPTRVVGADVFVGPAGEAVLARWPGQWVNLVADDDAFLLALLSSDGKGVHQAIWSNSAYLSWVYSGALASGLILTDVERRVSAGATAKGLQRALKAHIRLKPIETPGFQKILRRFGNDSRTPSSRTARSAGG